MQASLKRRLEHDLFLDQPGEKKVLIFHIHHGKPEEKPLLDEKVISYQKLLNARAIPYRLVVTNAQDHPEFEQKRYGDINAQFEIDLREPTTIHCTYNGKHKTDPLTQDLISQVRNGSSTVPAVQDGLDRFQKITNLLVGIARADRDIIQKIDSSGIKLAQLSQMNENDRVDRAVFQLMEQTETFAKEELYETDQVDRILTTLRGVEEKGLDAPLVALLAGQAALQASRKINSLDETDENFSALTEYATHLVDFARKFLAHQPGENWENCAAPLRDGFGQLLYVLKQKGVMVEQLALPEQKTLPAHAANWRG